MKDWNVRNVLLKRKEKNWRTSVEMTILGTRTVKPPAKKAPNKNKNRRYG